MPLRHPEVLIITGNRGNGWGARDRSHGVSDASDLDRRKPKLSEVVGSGFEPQRPGDSSEISRPRSSQRVFRYRGYRAPATSVTCNPVSLRPGCLFCARANSSESCPTRWMRSFLPSGTKRTPPIRARSLSLASVRVSSWLRVLLVATGGYEPWQSHLAAHRQARSPI